MAVVAGAAKHPPQPRDSREEGREGEGRAREGKGEERGGDRGGSKAGRRGTRRRRREEWQGEMKQTRGKYWASFTPITQQEGVLSTYMRTWCRDKARTQSYLAVHPCVLGKNCLGVLLQSPLSPATPAALWDFSPKGKIEQHRNRNSAFIIL